MATVAEVTGLNHVSIIVSKTSKALEFYCNLLSLKQDLSRPDLGYPGAWLMVGGAQIHLLELPNPDSTQGRPEHGGRDRHIALNVTNLEEIRHQMEAQNMPFTLSKSGRKALFCRDPDGNAIELIEALT